MRTKAVMLAVQETLPAEYRGEVGKLDVRGLAKLLHRVAVRDPDKYADISHKISTLGRDAAYWQGETLGLDDFEDPIDTPTYLAEMDNEVKTATQGIKDQDKLRETREAIWGKWAARLEGDAMKAGMQKGNAVAYSVASGARGKPLQLRAMLSTPALFEDYRGRIVPLFARRSYAQGVSPGEFLAGTFGARTSVTSTKVGTAKGGYLGKLMAQVAAPLVVTEQDCGTTNGIDLSTDDDDLRNRFLARDQSGLQAGGLLDRKSMAQLVNGKDKTVLVRSPMTCQAKSGLCSKCIGADPRGKMFPIGYAAGITASNALSEPLTQMALNAKHTSGASTLKRTYSGLDWLGKFVQIPDDFPDRAPIAEGSGAVGITKAPQGGHIVRVGGKDHYVPEHLELKVRDGDELEAGDALSDGVVRPDDVVRVAGLGQGRRYWADRFRQMLNDSGTPASRRNTEVMARATVNHVRILDADGHEEFLPDDVAPADMLLRDYTPPEDSRYVDPDDAQGNYLQAPALHYTVGTKVTPRVAKHLKDVNFGKIEVHEKGPNFAPEMPRLMTATAAQPDWMASLNTNYLRRQLSDRAARGQDTNFNSNIHYAPRLAAGVGFGENLATKGTY